jgi:hypothetical protein
MHTIELYFGKNFLFDTSVLCRCISQDIMNSFHDFYISWTVMKLKLERNKNLFKIDPFPKHRNRNLAASTNWRKMCLLMNSWLFGRADWDSGSTFVWRLLNLVENHLTFVFCVWDICGSLLCIVEIKRSDEQFCPSLWSKKSVIVTK